MLLRHAGFTHQGSYDMSSLQIGTKKWVDEKMKIISGDIAADSLTVRTMGGAVWEGLHPLEHLRSAQLVMEDVEQTFARHYGVRFDCRIPEPILPYAQIESWDRHFMLIYNAEAMTVKTLGEPSADWELERVEAQLRVAALQYSRECGWDMAPSPESGLWVLRFKMYDIHDYAVTPENVRFGDKSSRVISGLVVGFAVLQDRDGDGSYEALAHMWTAQTERRKGHAQIMLQEAKRLGMTTAETPYTELGAATLRKFGLKES